MQADRNHPSTVSCVILAALTIAAYSRVTTLGFVNMDDPLYVSGNPNVLTGLSWSGITWAFTTTSQANWHPLTWISLMLDATLLGGDARIYHATNLLLHVANVLLLFVILARMTGAIAKSAFVAALFAVHPLHVESVVWVAERKDVLSTLFGLLTLAAYVRYTARPSPRTYGAVVLAFGVGLLAKPMLVTLPLVLLLVDYWPLARVRTVGAGKLVLEKIPLLVLAAASSIVTLIVQQPAMERMESVAFGARLANAMVSYVIYVGTMLWPLRLSIFYPYPHGLSWQPVAAALLLLAVSVAAIAMRRGRPWLLFGWFWYVITLLPVIGLVQVGLQARADRYTYVPLIGLFIVVAWGVPALLERFAPWALRPATVGIAGSAILLSLGACTIVQIGYWRDGVTLFTHAVEVTSDNVLAQYNLSNALSLRGDADGELLHLREAYRIDPRFPDSHFNLTSALIRQRKLDEAYVLCEQAREYWPTEERTLVDLGIVALMREDYGEAERWFSDALRLYPDSAVAQHNLAVARAHGGRKAPD